MFYWLRKMFHIHEYQVIEKKSMRMTITPIWDSGNPTDESVVLVISRCKKCRKERAQAVGCSHRVKVNPEYAWKMMGY